MRKLSSELIPVQPRSGFNDGTKDSALWVRLAAFLSARTPNTQLTYSGVLSEWCRFLGAAIGSNAGAEILLNATDLQAIHYRGWLQQQPGETPRLNKGAKRREPRRGSHGILDGTQNTLANATIAKKFAILRRIYRMLIGSGLGLTINPFDSDRVPPPAKDSGQKRPTEMVPFELVQKIIALPPKDKPKGVRDRAILAALFGGALRRSEVASLRVGDLRQSRAGTTYLYLRSTKAKRDAEQALPPWAAELILAHHANRIEDGAGKADYLFVGFTGTAGKYKGTEAISPSGIYRLFKNYCRLAGAGEFVTPHSARATAITRLLDAGIPHREVQQFSRHASVQMVELYDKRRLGVEKNPGKLLDYD